MQLLSNVRPLHVAHFLHTPWTFQSRKGIFKCLTTKLSSPRPDQEASKQFKKFLSIGANKIELLEFLLRDWTHQRHKTVIRTKTIYFTLKEESFKISVQNGRIECLRTLQLSYKQEEADTKMFLAVNYACNRGVESITIHTVDSDADILTFWLICSNNWMSHHN